MISKAGWIHPQAVSFSNNDDGDGEGDGDKIDNGNLKDGDDYDDKNDGGNDDHAFDFRSILVLTGFQIWVINTLTL